MAARTRFPGPGCRHVGEYLTIRASLGEDGTWLAVMFVVTGLEGAWWLAAWLMGLAPAPYLLSYLALAFAGLAITWAAWRLLHTEAIRTNWTVAIQATLAIGIGASLFLPLKYAIPHVVPFWLDAPLAHGERAILGLDPWLLLDRTLGWATWPLDKLYGAWLPTQALCLFSVVIQPASAAKSRALVSYVLVWFVLGVVAATLLSSAGPLFYDRTFGGTAFAALRGTLEGHGAWVALAESDKMWTSLATGRPGIVAGISAVPSIHVAISVWMVLTARQMAPRLAPFAFAYALLIWIGSVQLGWHYVTDGLVGALGTWVIWALVRRRTGEPGTSRPGPDPALTPRRS